MATTDVHESAAERLGEDVELAHVLEAGGREALLAAQRKKGHALNLSIRL